MPHTTHSAYLLREAAADALEALAHPELGMRAYEEGHAIASLRDALDVIDTDSNGRRLDASEITFSPWRHGGWYTSVRIPTATGGTASGCVSRNYPDGKWRIVCDPRPGSHPGGDNDHTYATRTEAALAEQVLALTGHYA
jgi:hypothetical protein